MMIAATVYGYSSILRYCVFNAGRAVFIETFDPDLGVFRMDIASQVGASFDLGEALS
jgi:hypothetical protein